MPRSFVLKPWILVLIPTPEELYDLCSTYVEISLCHRRSCTDGTTDGLVRVGYVLSPTVFRVGDEQEGGDT
ncbi:hypothetical protein CsSME_00018520 [Camellia sinensis var. sinensis]